MPYNIPTSTFYRVTGEFTSSLTATLSNLYRIENKQFTSTLFHNTQENIVSKSSGNYQKSYEVVNTTGRRNNNLSIRDYPLTQSISRVKLNGQTDFTMPARTTNKSVIAVQFSAPGGTDVDANGQRDLESLEYSSNNSINTRNPVVRKQLNEDDKTHFSLTTSSLYTLHKTQRNTRYKIASATLLFETRSDNGFVSYAIPYHIDQQAWISQSFLKVEAEKKNHYVQYNEQTGSDYVFTSSMTGSELTKSWGSNYYGIYGYPSWIQTRAGENWRHKLLRNNSYYYVNRPSINQEGRGVRVDEGLTIGSGTFDSSSEGISIFKEPIIDFANEISFIRVKNIDNSDLIIKNPIYKNMFYNDELNNIYGIEDISKLKEQDTLKYFQDSEYTYTKGKKYQIYPPPNISGLNRTRKRENFIFEAWRDDSFRSQSQIYGGAVPNADNVRQITDPTHVGYTVPLLYAFNFTGSIWPLDMYIHPTMYQTGGIFVAGELMSSLMYTMYSGAAFNQRPWYSVVGYNPNTSSFISSSVNSILPWTAYIAANSTPFKDSENIFSKYINKSYKNYGIIPEFNVSEQITNETLNKLDKYLYDNSFIFSNTGSYFINKLTDSYIIKDKLQFNLDTVLQVRPYKNFYPCNITLECAKQLSASLASVPVYNNVPQGFNLAYNFNYILIGMSSFYNPGIMYTSIKAGLSMPSNDSYELTTSAIFEFQDIFDPYKVLNGKNGGGVPFTESLSTELYTNLVTNFLGEVKHSFCKNEFCNYFTSKLESDYKVFQSGTTYIMDIVLETGHLDISSSNITNSGTAIIGGVNYIGYKHNVIDTMIPPWWPGNISDDTSQGVGTTRITFTPTLSRKYTLDEILSLATVSFHRKFDDVTGTYQAYPKLTSSFDLFNKNTTTEGSTWEIKSKWEFPYLVMTGALDHFSSAIQTRQIETTWPEACVEYAGGLWHDFCDVPKVDQGIFLSIRDFNYNINGIDVKSASLADMVGFEYNKKKRVGELNNQKEISELVCIVPINKADDSFFLLNTQAAPILKGKKFKNNDQQGESIARENSNSETYEKNRLLCEKYMMPPKLDYTIKGIKPVLMFCTEVSDIWSKRDLAYIWQNLLPQNGLNHKEVSYKYEVTDQNDLDMLKNKEVYFMIFKCKLRAITNPVGKYGFNWPYDAFSLLELLRIEMITEGQ